MGELPLPLTPRQEREYKRAYCYWQRVMHQRRWHEIGQELELSGPMAKLYAYMYADQHRYPTPIVNARNTRQDIYIARTNGKTWQKIARLFNVSISKAKLQARSFAMDKGYRWPPWTRQ